MQGARTPRRPAGRVVSVEMPNQGLLGDPALRVPRRGAHVPVRAGGQQARRRGRVDRDVGDVPGEVRGGVPPEPLPLPDAEPHAGPGVREGEEPDPVAERHAVPRGEEGGAVQEPAGRAERFGPWRFQACPVHVCGVL